MNCDKAEMDPLMDHVVLLHLLGPDLGKSKNRNCSLMRFGLQLRKLFLALFSLGSMIIPGQKTACQTRLVKVAKATNETIKCQVAQSQL